MKLLNKQIESYAYLLYGLLLTAHIALVWWLPYFPTQDGPSHIYNLVILQDLLNGGHAWGEYYVSLLRAIPNLGFHIFAYPLLTLFSPATTERLFISLYIILMAGSVPYFMRSFNKPAFPFSFLVFPVMFNFNLMMGFYSYSIAVPVYLLAFGCCYRIRDNSPFSRFIIFNLMGFAIFYLHLIAFGIFILSLACLALSESGSLKSALNKLLNLMLLLSPALINLMLYLLRSARSFETTPIRYLSWQDRLIDLMTFSSATLSNWHLYSGCLLFYVFIRFLTHEVFSEEAKGSRREIYLRFLNDDTKCLLYLAPALVLICLFSPFMWGDGSCFNQRFPWVILLIALPVLHVAARSMSPFISSSLPVVISALFFIVNAAVMHQKSSCVEAFLEGLSVDIPKGAYVMTCKTGDSYFRIDVLRHAASYYGLSKGVVVIGNYEAATNVFPVRFKNTLPAFPPIDQLSYDAKGINWPQFPAIGYLLVWQGNAASNEESNKKLTLYYRETFKKGNLAVWHRI